MSTDELRSEQPAVSKVKVTRNAKGDPQWEITVVAGVSESEMDELRRIAVAQHRGLEQDLGAVLRRSIPSAASSPAERIS